MKKQVPSRPNLEQLKNQAKSLLKGQRAGRGAAFAEACARVRAHHARWRGSSDAALMAARLTLADAQLVIAKEFGYETWAALKVEVLSRQAE